MNKFNGVLNNVITILNQKKTIKTLKKKIVLKLVAWHNKVN